MNQRKLLPTLLAMLFTILASGCVTVIIEPSSTATSDLLDVINDAERLAIGAGTDSVLVVFDLDNTLMAMEQGLGSDQWYEWQKAQASQNPCDARVVGDRLAVQGALYFASAMRPTQSDAAQLVRRLQDEGFTVIALTSRGVDFRLQTFRELRRNGIDFRRSAISPETGWPEDFVPRNGIRPARYEDGVFLTTGQHKGAMLLALLERTRAPMPSAIVMADDKQSNLDQVMETFAPLRVPVRAWRYAGEDGNVDAFDAEMSDEMWQRLAPALQTIESVMGPDNYHLQGALDKPQCAP